MDEQIKTESTPQETPNAEQTSPLPPLPTGRTAAQMELKDWFKKVKFKKNLFGGVKEKDVWKKLEQADALYEKAIEAERARYDALLEVYRGGTHE